MMKLAVKILFLVTFSLTLLIAPVAIEIDLGGKAHALSSSGSGSDGALSDGAIAKTYKQSPNEPAPAHAPEPTTMLLFGAGAVGLVALKKKFTKKK